MNLFSPDSKFAQVMTAVGEMMLLNLCWILACLPLITVGAANTAMYTVMGQRLRKEDRGTVGPFFRAWRSNLKQATLFWVCQVFVCGSLGTTLFLPVPMALRVVAGILLVLVLTLFSLIYPQIARFRNGWFSYLRNAVILLVIRLKWVLLNLLLILLPVILFLLAPMEFLQLGFIWLLLGFSGLFLVSAELMQKILQPLEELSA